jgi:hypothetical protein
MARDGQAEPRGVQKGKIYIFPNLNMESPRQARKLPVGVLDAFDD